MKPGALLRLSLPLLAAFAGPAAAAAPTPPPSAALSVSLTGSVGYDDNVYAIDAGPLASIESGFAVATARLSTGFGPGVSLAYSPSVTAFFDQGMEDHVKHLLSGAWKQKAGVFAWDAASEFACIDGDDRGVDYGAGCGSAFSTAVPRERRDQWQNKSELSLRHDSALGFVRGVGRLQYWDMLTRREGNANYVDRHDLQGGLDLGRVLTDGGPEFYLGYRHGHQFQDRDANPASPRHASNDYARYLAGFDGKLGPALKLSAQAGWARHSYPGDAAIYAGSAHEEDLFADATLTWNLTSADELQLKTGQCRTISTTGTNSILLATHQLSWRHHFDARWSATLTGRVAQAEYAPAQRDDLDYTALASVTCELNSAWSCTLAASRDWGRDHHNDVAGLDKTLREFDRAVVTLGLTWKR